MKGAALHHIHKRKRLYKELQKTQPPHEFPHPDPRIKRLDKIVLFVSAIIPLASLPQIIQIWVYHQTEGVSIITWALYAFLTVPLLLYGIVHKEKPLIIMYSLWILVHIIIILGAVLY